MSVDKIAFHAEMSVAKLCLRCGHVGMFHRGVVKCPKCGVRFPPRSKEYDRETCAALARQTQTTPEENP